MRWVRGASVVVLVAVLAAGCGSAGKDKSTSAEEKEDAAASTSPDEAVGSATTVPKDGAEKSAGTTTTSTTKAAGTAAEGDKPKSAASGTAPPYDVGEPDGSELPSEPLPLEVQLSSTCVRPGTSLTVTVKSVPKAQLGYDTTWADGKSGWDAANRGGSGRGTADDAGTWKNTATIGADAPKGKAKVDVIGVDPTGRMGSKTVEYQVSDALGKCS